MFHQQRNTLYQPLPSPLSTLYAQLQMYAYEIWSNPSSRAYVSPLEVPLTQWTWAVPPDTFQMTRTEEINKAFSTMNKQKIVESVGMISDVMAKFLSKQKAVELLDLALSVPELNTQYRCGKKHLRSIKMMAYDYLRQIQAQIMHDMSFEQVGKSTLSAF